MRTTTSTKEFHFTERSQSRGQADEGARDSMPRFGCECRKPSVGKAGPPLAQTGGFKDAATPSAQLRITAGGAGRRPVSLVENTL